MAGAERHVVAGIWLIDFNGAAQSILPHFMLHAGFIHRQHWVTQAIRSRCTKLGAGPAVRADVSTIVGGYHVAILMRDARDPVECVIRARIKAVGRITGVAVRVTCFQNSPKGIVGCADGRLSFRIAHEDCCRHSLLAV